MEKELKELKKYSDEKIKKEARVQNDSNLNKKNLQELPNEVLLHIFDYFHFHFRNRVMLDLVA